MSKRCPDCNKEILETSTRCKVCSSKFRIKHINDRINRLRERKIKEGREYEEEE